PHAPGCSVPDHGCLSDLGRDWLTAERWAYATVRRGASARGQPSATEIPCTSRSTQPDLDPPPGRFHGVDQPCHLGCIRRFRSYLMHPVVPSLIMAVYLTSDETGSLLNDGHMRLFDEVRVREGSLLQPKFPAPLGQRSLTWIRLQAVFTGLINLATSGASVASDLTSCTRLFRP